MITSLIKEMRQQCHALSQSTENHVHKSVHVHDFLKSIKLSRAWMGKLLGLLGKETPYKNDGNRHSKQDIEPVADTSTTYMNLNSMNQVERIDWLREQVNEHIKTFEKVLDGESASAVASTTCLISIHQHLCEARFHLGFELGRLRDTE